MDTASASGFSVDSAAYGLYVSSAQETGVFVNTAGNPSTVPAPSPGKTGFEVAGAERVGLQVGYAGIDGIYVAQADRNGVTVNQAGSPSAISFSGGFRLPSCCTCRPCWRSGRWSSQLGPWPAWPYTRHSRSRV